MFRKILGLFRRQRGRTKTALDNYLEKSWAVVNPIKVAGTDIDKPYAQHPWVYAAVNAISSRVASVPYRLFSGSGPITSGPWWRVFRQPNQYWNHGDLWSATVTTLLLNGNAIWVLDRRSWREAPKRIVVLSHKRFQLVTDKKSNTVKSWIYRPPNRPSEPPIELAPYQIVWCRLYNPYGGPLDWGLSPLEAAKLSVQMDWAAMLFNKSYFENSANPGGVLKVDRLLTPEEKKLIEEQFSAKYEGLQKAFRTIFLEGGVSYDPFTISHDDMLFIDQRKLTREEICAVFNVPSSLLGVMERVYKATADTIHRQFWEGTVLPLIRLIEATLDSQLWAPIEDDPLKVEPTSPRGAFDLTEVSALQELLDAKLARAVKLWNMGVPFNVINERLGLGFPNLPGVGDTSFVPVNVAPYGKPLVSARTHPVSAPAERSDATPADEWQHFQERPSATPGPSLDFLMDLARPYKAELLTATRGFFQKVKLRLRKQAERAKPGDTIEIPAQACEAFEQRVAELFESFELAVKEATDNGARPAWTPGKFASEIYRQLRKEIAERGLADGVKAARRTLKDMVETALNVQL